MDSTQLILIFFAIAFFVWRLSTAAGRLDRVHIRRDQALTSLRLQLAWRTSSVAKLLMAGVLDPVSANVLSQEVHAVTASSELSLLQYMSAESEMTRALGAVFDDREVIEDILRESPHMQQVFTDLAHACRRVELARRFHNDAVGAAQLLHRRPLVRYFRLAGHTDMPVAIDLDDTVPAGLEML